MPTSWCVSGLSPTRKCTANPSPSRAQQIFLDYMLFMQEYDSVPSFASFTAPAAVSRRDGPVALRGEQVTDRPLRLMREASIRSRKSGENNISANSVRKVTEVRMDQA